MSHMYSPLAAAEGIYTALATPFAKGGEIDYPALTRLMEQQLRHGISGFVVCGTTGESPTLTREEKANLFRFVYAFAQGKNIDLMAGTGTNDTRETIELTKMAETIGYRRVLVVVPYYNKPSPAGLQQHFEAVADSCLGELVLYNVPGRTNISLTADTIVELAAHPKINAIKEASGNLEFLAEIQKKLRLKNRSLQLLSGDDETYLEFIRAGGHGVISVASHVCPTGMRSLEASHRAADREEGDRLQKAYLSFFQDLFIEANPGPLKWMLKQLGVCENVLRLPLVPISKIAEEKLKAVVSKFRKVSEEYVE
ncbi:MAG: 4-hydroxy-tetrahydrodipicolinate synthase [Cryobacterium sp.]|nr:4-hydroxy-tetrahydrodipicolinate synthase [Oligoflexia bacterium]